MIAQRTLDALKERTPDYLERVHGIVDLRKQFSVPWREDAHPSAKYNAKTCTVIDMSRNEAKNVFQLAGSDFGIDRFPEQVSKVAEILGEQVEDDGLPMRAAPRRRRTESIEPPKAAGFTEDVRDACFDAASALLLNAEAEHGREWLVNRGFTDREAWARFGLGFIGNWQHKRIHDSFAVCENKRNVAGFVTVPYFNARGEVYYCALRTVVPKWATDPNPNRKEWVPKGVTRPLYNEHYLSAALGAVAVTEGPVDAISLSVMTGIPAIGLGSTSLAGRFKRALYHADAGKRPGKVVLNLDAAGDEAGAKASTDIATFLDGLRIPHSELRMPAGVKDANEWLQLLVRS